MRTQFSSLLTFNHPMKSHRGTPAGGRFGPALPPSQVTIAHISHHQPTAAVHQSHGHTAGRRQHPDRGSHRPAHPSGRTVSGAAAAAGWEVRRGGRRACGHPVTRPENEPERAARADSERRPVAGWARGVTPKWPISCLTSCGGEARAGQLLDINLHLDTARQRQPAADDPRGDEQGPALRQARPWWCTR